MIGSPVGIPFEHTTDTSSLRSLYFCSEIRPVRSVVNFVSANWNHVAASSSARSSQPGVHEGHIVMMAACSHGMPVVPLTVSGECVSGTRTRAQSAEEVDRGNDESCDLRALLNR